MNVPSVDYLGGLSRMCKANGTLLIVDEIQTGFCRTGTMFAIEATDAEADFLMMGKGIAGGFPLAGFAMTEEVASKLEVGDHGGTYCGNPLACAVAHAVVSFLIDNNASGHATEMGQLALNEMRGWQQAHPDIIKDVRGRGRFMVEFCDAATAARIADECLSRKVFVRQTQGTGIRVFPSVIVERDVLMEGLGTLREAIEVAAKEKS